MGNLHGGKMLCMESRTSTLIRDYVDHHAFIYGVVYQYPSWSKDNRMCLIQYRWECKLMDCIILKKSPEILKINKITFSILMGSSSTWLLCVLMFCSQLLVCKYNAMIDHDIGNKIRKWRQFVTEWLLFK